MKVSIVTTYDIIDDKTDEVLCTTNKKANALLIAHALSRVEDLDDCQRIHFRCCPQSPVDEDDPDDLM